MTIDSIPQDTRQDNAQRWPDGAPGDSRGLFTHHIFTVSPIASLASHPQIQPEAEREWFGELEVWTDGSVARIRLDTHVALDDGFKPIESRIQPGEVSELVDIREARAEAGESQRDWVRGAVDASFSPASRRRLLQETAKIDSRIRPLFITLTYPDNYPDSPDTWKAHLRAFQARMSRKYPDMAAIWRMELIDRKSGVNVGRVVPHFHIITWPNSPDLDANEKLTAKTLKKFRGWVSWAWFQIVGSGDDRHLRAGTNVKAIYNAQGIKRYISKYVAKAAKVAEIVDLDTGEIVPAFPDGVGRLWGVWGKENLPLSGVVRLILPAAQAFAVMRAFKSWAGVQEDYGLVSLHCFLQRPRDFLENFDSLIAPFLQDDIFERALNQ